MDLVYTFGMIAEPILDSGKTANNTVQENILMKELSDMDNGSMEREQSGMILKKKHSLLFLNMI